jgi:hypothetical protein
MKIITIVIMRRRIHMHTAHCHAQQQNKQQTATADCETGNVKNEVCKRIWAGVRGCSCGSCSCGVVCGWCGVCAWVSAHCTLHNAKWASGRL